MLASLPKAHAKVWLTLDLGEFLGKRPYLH